MEDPLVVNQGWIEDVLSKPGARSIGAARQTRPTKAKLGETKQKGQGQQSKARLACKGERPGPCHRQASVLNAGLEQSEHSG